jgi:hypothetical protein
MMGIRRGVSAYHAGVLGDEFAMFLVAQANGLGGSGGFPPELPRKRRRRLRLRCAALPRERQGSLRSGVLASARRRLLAASP